jgi:hypothetical protein
MLLPVWIKNLWINCLVWTLIKFIVLSLDPVPRYSLFGENLTVKTGPICMYVCMYVYDIYMYIEKYKNNNIN